MTKLSPARPLSPHLQIYRFTWLMASSIIHRITGAALYFGLLIVAGWLLSLMSGEKAYDVFQTLLRSWPGLIVLFGYTWALLHHALGGVRHLIWDTGRGLRVPQARALAIASFVGSAMLTLLVWYLAGAFA